jgi:hypothetical protein
VLVIDEADKAPEHVVAIFRSLAGQGELTLSDGRRLTCVVEREGDLPIHPSFKFCLILLANRQNLTLNHLHHTCLLVIAPFMGSPEGLFSQSHQAAPWQHL